MKLNYRKYLRQLITIYGINATVSHVIQKLKKDCSSNLLHLLEMPLPAKPDNSLDIC